MAHTLAKQWFFAEMRVWVVAGKDPCGPITGSKKGLGPAVVTTASSARYGEGRTTSSTIHDMRRNVGK